MPKINDGGYAFPTNSGLTYKGMSLRAYFAGQALPSVVIRCVPQECEHDESMEQMFARKAVSVADALIAELEKDTTS